jgi:hypothetical protein
LEGICWRFRTGSPWRDVPQQTSLGAAVTAGASKLILSEAEFVTVFPSQRAGATAPPGPPLIGTLNSGDSPTKVKITGLPNSLGTGITLSSNPIVCTLNTGDSTADFSELTNLTQSQAIASTLPGVSLSSRPTDVAWAPWSSQTGAYYFYIAGIGGTVELFASGYSNGPSVRAAASNNTAPNKIINNIGGLSQPSAVQWITDGNAAVTFGGYSLGVLVAETGENRVQQLAVTSQNPSILFDTINASHPAGLGPIDLTGDPAAVGFAVPNGPRFTTYYVANAGEGTVQNASYQGGLIATKIPVPGVLLVASWWSR